jgi:hypothetical protein
VEETIYDAASQQVGELAGALICSR